MKRLSILLLCLSGVIQTHALVISEIMSNPTGDDNGREWIEIYNDSGNQVDLSTLTISIKGGAFISVSSVQGGTILQPASYAIIASVVSGATKFLVDYPTYSGVLMKSSISLVNTGVTSISLKVNGNVVDTLPSYIAAKEGSTLSLVSGSFAVSSPTPGTENQATQDSGGSSNTPSSASTTDTQSTVAQMSPPSADIILYMPAEKVVIAGAETVFSTFGLTRKGDTINNLLYTWAYGDGGQGTGSTTEYRYAYPGRYIAQVEGSNGYVIGTGRMIVRVVPPDIFITKVDTGRYGVYIDITNPNNYDLDMSQWKLSIDGGMFSFPKNTLLAGGGSTHFSGTAMGFASTTISSSTVIRILFPNQEEVTRFSVVKEDKVSPQPPTLGAAPITIPKIRSMTLYNKKEEVLVHPSPVSFKNKAASSSPSSYKDITKKDTRVVSFFRSIFGSK